jgi:hypothetical protein
VDEAAWADNTALMRRTFWSSLLLLSFLAPVFVSQTGCIVRTEPRRRYYRAEPDHGSHRHCHYRGGQRRKGCHNHPHGAGHH